MINEPEDVDEHHAYEDDGEPEEAIHELSELLRIEVTELVELIGGYWYRCPDPEYDRIGDLRPLRDRFIAGRPPQVMIEVEYDIQVAVPEGAWYGVADLFFRPKTVVATFDRFAPLDRDLLRDAVRRAEKQRRAGFRFCRYCRQITGREYRLGDDTCMSCASRYHGIVY